MGAYLSLRGREAGLGWALINFAKFEVGRLFE